MAITKNIVEMMNGTISVESETGKGSTFTVEFELKLQNMEKTEQQIKELEGLRALVVDDDFNTCDSVSKMLKQIGLRSEWTTSGREAVYRAKSAHEEGDSYHTFIIDWQMPIMNGYEATRTIRRLPGKDVKNLPIIAMTANALEEDKGAALMNGMNAHIAKPIDMDIFIPVLKKFLE